MNAPWRHHFIPQMLLRGFRDPSGSLYYFDRDDPQKRVQYNTPKALFFEKNLYSSVDYDSGALDPSLELYFDREVENRAVPIIKKIVEAARAGQRPGLTAAEKAHWGLFVYFQIKRTPEFMQRHMGEFEAALEKWTLEVEGGTLTFTEEMRAQLVRNVRIGVQGTPSQSVAAKQATRGLVIAVIKDPKKSFIVGSTSQVSLSAPGLTGPRDGKNELWVTVRSDVAVAFGGPPGSEHVVSVTDHDRIRRLNKLIAVQSSKIAGRSRELVSSLIDPR